MESGPVISRLRLWLAESLRDCVGVRSGRLHLPNGINVQEKAILYSVGSQGNMGRGRERDPVKEGRRKKDVRSVRKTGHNCMCVSAGRTAHTYMDMVTSLWFIRTLGLPPGPDRDGRLFKKPFPPRAARETSGRSEQSASSFIKHLQERSLLDTRITFEIPPVTSQPPKHGSWSFKYLYVRKMGGGGGLPSVSAIEMKQDVFWEKKGTLLCLQRFATIQDTQTGSNRISSQQKCDCGLIIRFFNGVLVLSQFLISISQQI